MDHRQEDSERDELRAKFTLWLETVIKRAKIDYLRKYRESTGNHILGGYTGGGAF